MPHQLVHLRRAVDLAAVKRCLEVVQLVGVGLLRQDRGAVVVGEGGLDYVDIVGEIEHEGIVLLFGVARLRRESVCTALTPDSGLVNVHSCAAAAHRNRSENLSAQTRKRWGLLTDAGGGLVGREAVERGLADLRPPVFMLAGKGDERAVGTVALDEVGANGVVVADGALDAARHHHRPRLAPYLLQAGHLLMEVVDHDLCLETDGVVVVLDIAPQLLSGALLVELGVARHRLDQPVVAVHRRVMGQHVDDEALLDRLLHCVNMEGPVPDRAALGYGCAEDLERLVLGRGREGEVAGIAQQLLRLHQAVDHVLKPSLPRHPPRRPRPRPAPSPWPSRCARPGSSGPRR